MEKLYDVFFNFWSEWFPEVFTNSHWFKLLAILMTIFIVIGIVILFLRAVGVKSSALVWLIPFIMFITAVFYYFEFVYWRVLL